MHKRMWLWLLAFGLGVGLVAGLPAGAADKASPETVAQLVEKLGSSKFTERDQATKELEALGEQALDALKKAAQGDDLETKRRAEELIKKVEAKLLTKRVLEPTKVRLTFKDTPLKDAIAEVQKKTGLNIILNDPENKLADRKVTVDTGETTLWEAVDLFVEKAGLVESANPAQGIGPGPTPQPPIKRVPLQPVPQPVQPLQPQLNVVPPGAIQVQGGAAPAQPAQAQPVPPAPVPVQAAPLLKPGRPPFLGYQPNTLILGDGKPESLPTHYAGAVRIRALPPGTQLPGYQSKDDELAVALQVTPEPKLQFQSVVNVRIDKAVDDQDQTLLQAAADAGNGGDQPVAGFAKARFVVRPGFVPGSAPVPVRLQKGEKAAKSLKELTGVVSLQVRTPAEPLMTVEKLLKAAGDEVKGESGGRIKVVDVSKDDKATTLKLEFEQPQDVQPGFVPAPGVIMPLPGPVPLPPQPLPPQFLPQQQINAQVQVQVQVQPAAPPAGGGAPVPPNAPPTPPAQTSFNGLSVQDEKGNALPLLPSNIQATNKGNTVVWQYTLTVPAQKGQAEPAKLVYLGSKLVTVDIPFTLKGVPVQ